MVSQSTEQNAGLQGALADLAKGKAFGEIRKEAHIQVMGRWGVEQDLLQPTSRENQ